MLSRTVSELSQLIVQILDTAFLSHPLGGGLSDNVRYSSGAHWKARSGLLQGFYSQGKQRESQGSLGILKYCS